MAVLQVGVCGAGVAGLAAAIALRKIGHDVEVSQTRPHLSTISPLLDKLPIERTSGLTSSQVFERSRFQNENGAAVSITPNGTRILDHWGFDFVKAGGIENIQVSTTSEVLDMFVATTAAIRPISCQVAAY